MRAGGRFEAPGSVALKKREHDESDGDESDERRQPFVSRHWGCASGAQGLSPRVSPASVDGGRFADVVLLLPFRDGEALTLRDQDAASMFAKIEQHAAPMTHVIGVTG